MGYIWLSFSYNGKNQGCCNVEAGSKSEALEICDRLGIIPDYDDIAAFKIKEPELPLDCLVDPEDLRKKKYLSTKDITICNKCMKKVFKHEMSDS